MIPVIKLIIEQIVGPPSRPSERLFYSNPADPIDSNLSTLYRDKTLESMLGDMGYDPEPINEGMAVTYSELADSNFTGLDILFGAGMTNICLAYCAVPVVQLSVARDDDWIDQQTAQVTGTTVDKVMSIKEDDFQLDFCADVGGVEDALSTYYGNLLGYVTKNIEYEANKEDIEGGPNVPIIVTGGTSSPEGPEGLFERHLEDSTIPSSVSEVRSIGRPLYNVVRGPLVAARSEGESDGGASDPEPGAEAAPESN